MKASSSEAEHLFYTQGVEISKFSSPTNSRTGHATGAANSRRGGIPAAIRRRYGARRSIQARIAQQEEHRLDTAEAARSIRAARTNFLPSLNGEGPS